MVMYEQQRPADETLNFPGAFAATPVMPGKKKRGRPRGSKNKPKGNCTTVVNVPTITMSTKKKIHKHSKRNQVFCV